MAVNDDATGIHPNNTFPGEKGADGFSGKNHEKSTQLHDKNPGWHFPTLPQGCRGEIILHFGCFSGSYQTPSRPSVSEMSPTGTGALTPVETKPQHGLKEPAHW